MSPAETAIWMSGMVILWAGMALVAVRMIERKSNRRKTDEH